MPERYRLSHHAQEEILRRQIPKEWIGSVLGQPEQRIQEGANKEVWQSRFRDEAGRMYLVRAIVATDKDPAVIVTAYRTSKLEKYWRTE